MDKEIDTDQLIEGAAAGDEQAKADLLERFRPRLRHMISLRMAQKVSTRFDDSDVVQEALVIASSRLDDYLTERPLPFYAWLRQIAWQRLLKLQDAHVKASKRSADREAPAPLQLSSDSMLELVDRLAGTVTGPNQAVVRDELRTCLEKDFTAWRVFVT